jgi:hypothetical protein
MPLNLNGIHEDEASKKICCAQLVQMIQKGQSLENEVSYSGQYDMTTYFANYGKHDWYCLSTSM